MFEDESDWLPGQWGEGGPGGVYKLNGATGYAPELIATIGLDGRPNTGAGLGNIAFDAAHNQLFVSDLETGIVHRLSTDGAFLSSYDHGIDGRASHYDAIIGSTQNPGSIALDTGGAALIGACADAAGAALPFASTPACWNFADFRRRVWGMAVSGSSGQTRLYYGVWGSEAFDNPEWGGDDAVNTIWSIGIDASGEFVTSDIRLEIALPGMDAEPTARAPSDIAISGDLMVVAERGGVRNLGLDAVDAFAVPHASRVLRYVRGTDGVWLPDDRYDVSFNDRKDIGSPFLRAGSAGGVDFGYGYDETGNTDGDRPRDTVWMTGDSLCSVSGGCVEPTIGTRTDTSEVHGLQGTPQACDELLRPVRRVRTRPAARILSGRRAACILHDRRRPEPRRLGRHSGRGSLHNDATRIGDVGSTRPAPAAVPRLRRKATTSRSTRQGNRVVWSTPRVYLHDHREE